MSRFFVLLFLAVVAFGTVGCFREARTSIKPLAELVTPAGPTWVVVRKEDKSDRLFLCEPPAEGKNLPRCTAAVMQKAVIHDPPEVSD